MIVLITGGASGLGEAMTRRIATDRESTVYFTYSKSEASAKKIEADFSNAFSVKCDFDDEREVNGLREKMAQFNLDVLINNAYSGTFIDDYFHKTPPESFLTGFRSNILPTIMITQAAINAFRKRKSGKIITILTSALVNTPPVGSSIYVANKAYMEELTKIWATENAKFNITSNAVSPALMLTNFTKEVDERTLEQIRDHHPLKRILTIEEVAGTVLFLCGASQQMNGINIIMNSGTNIK